MYLFFRGIILVHIIVNTFHLNIILELQALNNEQHVIFLNLEKISHPFYIDL